jgi:hypothetical protein
MRAVLPVLALMTALTAATLATPAAAQPAIPPPQAELGEPPPPPGPPARFVLEPGHWRWNAYAHRYVWIRRHWIPAGAGFVHFVPGHWAGGVWIRAHWTG